MWRLQTEVPRRPLPRPPHRPPLRLPQSPAQPLHAFKPPQLPRTRPHLRPAQLRLDQWHVYAQRDIPGPGWKIAWEGYLESYHHNTVHPNTVGRFTIGNLTLHDTYGPHQRIVFGRRSLPELLDQPPERWEPDAHIRRIHLGFPNLAVSGILGDHCLVSQVFPGPTPDTTLTRQTVLSAREPRTDEEKAATEAFSQIALKAVRDEDYAIGAGVQSAIRSGANQAFTIGRNDPAVQHFHRMVERYAGPPPVAGSAATRSA